MDTVTQVQITNKAVYISHNKDMNPTILPPAMSK